jgi:hypothetical protein
MAFLRKMVEVEIKWESRTRTLVAMSNTCRYWRWVICFLCGWCLVLFLAFYCNFIVSSFKHPLKGKSTAWVSCSIRGMKWSC